MGFDIVVMGEIKETFKTKITNRSKALSQDYHRKQLSVDFDHAYVSQEYADVTIVCGEKEFMGHKMVLVSRSPVFRTMFEANMKEKNSNRVEIKNMEPEVFERMLRYIYTGHAMIDPLAKELFAVADQYQLEKLKELREAKLCSSIDADNCIELLILGDLHNTPTLKAAALAFVSKNLHKIENSEWKRSLVQYPMLIAEVMEMMMPTNFNSTKNEEKKRIAFS